MKEGLFIRTKEIKPPVYLYGKRYRTFTQYSFSKAIEAPLDQPYDGLVFQTDQYYFHLAPFNLMRW